MSIGSQFDNRLKYLQRRERALKVNNPVQEISDSENNNVLSTPEEDLLFLKESVINQIDLDIIKQKLNNTRELRREKMKDLKFDIRESLPFFLISFTLGKHLVFEFK